MHGRFAAFLAAFALLGAPAFAADDVIPPKVNTTTPGGLSLSDGNFTYSVTDLAMGPLVLERYFRGGPRQPNYGMFGRNFSSNFDIYVGRNPTTSGKPDILIVHIGNSANGQWQQSKTNPASVINDNDDALYGELTYDLTLTRYKYVDSSGTIYTFTPSYIVAGVPFGAFHNSQRVSTIDFPDGRRQTFSYTTAAKPRLVEDSSGYAILFDYNASDDVVAACVVKRSETYVSTSSTCAGLGSAAITATYGYTSGLLTSATDPLGKTTTYTNALLGVTCVKPPGYSNCTVSQNLGPSDHTGEFFGNIQTLADGGVWTMSSEDEARVPRGMEGPTNVSGGHMVTELISPDLQGTQPQLKTVLTFTKSSPYSITDPLARVTQYRFNGGETSSNPSFCANCVDDKLHGKMLIYAKYPEGNEYKAEYFGPRNAVTKEEHVPKGGGTPLTKLYGYYSNCFTSPATPQNCAKPLWVKDPKGNQTDFSYASHGGVLTEMQPAPSIGAARPLKVTTWALRYAWVKNSGGTLGQVTTGTYSGGIYVKNTETVCETAAGTSPAATCNSSAPQTVTTYEYGTNGTGQSLLLKGVAVTANGVTHRTCYGYDTKDRKIFETKPNAMLSSCP